MKNARKCVESSVLVLGDTMAESRENEKYIDKLSFLARVVPVLHASLHKIKNNKMWLFVVPI